MQFKDDIIIHYSMCNWIRKENISMNVITQWIKCCKLQLSKTRDIKENKKLLDFSYASCQTIELSAHGVIIVNASEHT